MKTIQETFKHATQQILDKDKLFIGTFNGTSKTFKTQQEADSFTKGVLLVEREYEDVNGRIKL
jgi:hypothetical protein